MRICPYVPKKFQTDAKSLGGDGAVPDVDMPQEISSDEEALSTSSEPPGEFGPPATPEKIPDRIRTDRASSPIEEVTLSAMEKKGRGRGKELQKGQGSKRKKRKKERSKRGRYQTASTISRAKARYCIHCGEELNDGERYLGVWNTHRVPRWTFRNDFDLYLCCCSGVWVEGVPWPEYTVRHPVRQGKRITVTRRNP